MNDEIGQEPVELPTGVPAETMFDDGLSDEALDRQEATALSVHSGCFTAGH